MSDGTEMGKFIMEMISGSSSQPYNARTYSHDIADILDNAHRYGQPSSHNERNEPRAHAINQKFNHVFLLSDEESAYEKCEVSELVKWRGNGYSGPYDDNTIAGVLKDQLITFHENLTFYAVKTGGVRILCRETKARALFNVHSSPVVHIEALPSETSSCIIASLSTDGNLLVWTVSENVTSGIVFDVLFGKEILGTESCPNIRHFAWAQSSEGYRCAYLENTLEIRVIDLDIDDDGICSESLVCSVCSEDDDFVDFQFSGDSSQLATISGDGDILIWSLAGEEAAVVGKIALDGYLAPPPIDTDVREDELGVDCLLWEGEYLYAYSSNSSQLLVVHSDSEAVRQSLFIIPKVNFPVTRNNFMVSRLCFDASGEFLVTKFWFGILETDSETVTHRQGFVVFHVNSEAAEGLVIDAATPYIVRNEILCMYAGVEVGFLRLLCSQRNCISEMTVSVDHCSVAQAESIAEKPEVSSDESVENEGDFSEEDNVSSEEDEEDELDDEEEEEEIEQKPQKSVSPAKPHLPLYAPSNPVVAAPTWSPPGSGCSSDSSIREGPQSFTGNEGDIETEIVSEKRLQEKPTPSVILKKNLSKAAKVPRGSRSRTPKNKRPSRVVSEKRMEMSVVKEEQNVAERVEVPRSKVSTAEQTLISKLDKLFERHHAKLMQRVNADKKREEKYVDLVPLLTLRAANTRELKRSEQLASIVTNNLRREMESLVSSGLEKKLTTRLARVIEQTVSNAEERIAFQMKNEVLSGKNISELMEVPLKKAVESTFAGFVLPALESAFGEMFRQVDEHLQHTVEAREEAFAEQLETQQDLLKEMSAQMRELTANQKKLESRLSEMRSRSPVVPARSVREVAEECLRNSDFNEAFMGVLRSGDTELVTWLCGEIQSNMLTVFRQLQSPVLLSLIQQLSSSLADESNTYMKLLAIQSGIISMPEGNEHHKVRVFSAVDAKVRECQSMFTPEEMMVSGVIQHLIAPVLANRK